MGLPTDSKTTNRLTRCDSKTKMSDSVKAIVSKAVRDLGYRKSHNLNWSKDYPDLIHVVGLNKSRWGLEYYLETGIWLKTFGPTESPKYFECHVRSRIESDSGPGDEIDSALNEEDYVRMDSAQRLRIISAALQHAEEKFFGRAKTLEGLRDLVVNRPKVMFAVNKCVLEFFGLPLPK